MLAYTLGLIKVAAGLLKTPMKTRLLIEEFKRRFPNTILDESKSIQFRQLLQHVRKDRAARGDSLLAIKGSRPKLLNVYKHAGPEEAQKMLLDTHKIPVNEHDVSDSFHEMNFSSIEPKDLERLSRQKKVDSITYEDLLKEVGSKEYMYRDTEAPSIVFRGYHDVPKDVYQSTLNDTKARAIRSHGNRAIGVRSELSTNRAHATPSLHQAASYGPNIAVYKVRNPEAQRYGYDGPSLVADDSSLRGSGGGFPLNAIKNTDRRNPLIESPPQPRRLETYTSPEATSLVAEVLHHPGGNNMFIKRNPTIDKIIAQSSKRIVPSELSKLSAYTLGLLKAASPEEFNAE